MVTKEGYKQTEIGVIPQDWDVSSILKCIENNGLIRGPFGGALKKEFFVSEGYKVYEQKNAIYKSVDLGEYFIDKNKYLELSRFQLKSNDFIVSCSGTIGRIYSIPDKFKEGVINQALLIIRIDKNKCNNRFFEHYFTSDWFQSKITDSTQGGAMKNMVGMAEFKMSTIPLPSLREQTAIATALSDADGLITGLEKLISKKRNIKQGAMQLLLQPKEGWEVKKLGEIATIVRGASPRPIEDTKWFDNQSPIGWVRISDVTKSKKVLTETTQKLSDLGVKNSRLVENGNLIMSICATVGRPIFTTFDVCIHDGFVVFRNPQVDKEYLYYFLTFIEDNWSKSGQTGSQMNLNTTLINRTEIPFPKSNEEQTRIAKIFSDMDAELSSLEQKLEKYKKIKLGMMQELLTGKIRLNQDLQDLGINKI